MKVAANYLHRSKYSDDPTIHRAPVCIICDCFVIGTDRIRKLKEHEIKEHGHRLSCESYEKYHNIEMDNELRKQYNVSGFPGLLLSPRSQKDDNGYIACSSCYNSMRPKDKKKKHPPKFSIANGFVIGTFPKKIKIVSGPRAGEFREINVEDDNDVSEVLRALVSPVRPYGYVFAYTAGQHESIKGDFQFFEMDQPKIGGAMQGLSQAQQSVYAMICGSVTNDQRKIIRERVQIDTQKYVDIMTWLIEHSTKPSIKNMTPPKDCPVPPLFEDPPLGDASELTQDRNLEHSFGGGTYYFSSAQDPSQFTSVYQSESQFAHAIVNGTPPTLLVYGGKRTNLREADIEDVLPFAFPYGSGGPKTKRRVNVSLDACIKRYFRTAMPQFMRSEVVFVLEHMFARHVSYKTGIVKLRNNIGGQKVGDILGNCTIEDFKKILENEDDNSLSGPVKMLMKSISTTCQALGHTEDAAKFARKCHFATMDHFGLNSLFLTISPCDECSFRVRLFADPNKNVSV
jgi:YHS domain-containing protein